ncbi:MAG: hypothetical protein H7256_10800 [Bdellovibrio sp.]|nr:hypothetical protein [Bdellovibrio sp.]
MAKEKSKSKILSKIIDVFSGKKSTSRVKKTIEEGPAHSPGHKKMKNKFNLTSGAKIHTQTQAALNNLTRGAIVARNESPQRRIISGASLNKKGRLA